MAGKKVLVEEAVSEDLSHLTDGEVRERSARIRTALALVAVPPAASDYRGKSIEQAVTHCARVYADDQLGFALAMWRATLPDLLDRHSAQQYVACIAWGMKYGLLDANTAKSMMYVAQNLLTVLRIAMEQPERHERQLDAAPLFTDGQLVPTRGKDVG